MYYYFRYSGRTAGATKHMLHWDDLPIQAHLSAGMCMCMIYLHCYGTVESNSAGLKYAMLGPILILMVWLSMCAYVCVYKS